MSNKNKNNNAVQQQRMNDAVKVDEMVVETPSPVLANEENEEEAERLRQQELETLASDLSTATGKTTSQCIDALEHAKNVNQDLEVKDLEARVANSRQQEPVVTVAVKAESVELNPEDLEEEDTEGHELQTRASDGKTLEIQSPNPLLQGGEESQDEEARVANSRQQSDTEMPEGMEGYFEAYPGNKTFYRTTDGQVFLQGDKQWAKAHQDKLGGDFETINR